MTGGNGACEPRPSRVGGTRLPRTDIRGAATASGFDQPTPRARALEPGRVGEGPSALARDEGKGGASARPKSPRAARSSRRGSCGSRDVAPRVRETGGTLPGVASRDPGRLRADARVWQARTCDGGAGPLGRIGTSRREDARARELAEGARRLWGADAGLGSRRSGLREAAVVGTVVPRSPVRGAPVRSALPNQAARAPTARPPGSTPDGAVSDGGTCPGEHDVRGSSPGRRAETRGLPGGDVLDGEN